jgi:stress-induced morphogen
MTEEEAKSLCQKLASEFAGEATYEPVNGHRRYRFAITSSRFDKLSHLQRQDEVWKVVDRELPREATLDISMILAFAPADLTTTK